MADRNIEQIGDFCSDCENAIVGILVGELFPEFVGIQTRRQPRKPGTGNDLPDIVSCRECNAVTGSDEGSGERDERVEMPSVGSDTEQDLQRSRRPWPDGPCLLGL